MTDAPSNQLPQRRWWLVLLIAAVVGFVTWFASIAVRVVQTAALNEIHPADAIVVFGAAEYSGHPSPVLRARLDHAFDLFQKHLAPIVIITGGSGADPHYSEGGVGHDYLMHRGIPDSSLIA